jgi:signal peptide peptidase SppA
VQALADEVYSARGKKPIIAQVNSFMASAAYWIGSAADEIVMTPGAEAGSIGVYMMHKDVSAAAEQDGVKVTFIKAGKYKTEGNAFEALGAEALTAFQATVDSFYVDFTKAVARNRSVDVSAVTEGFGQGRMVKDYAAVKAGLADSVATLDQTLKRLGKSSPPKKSLSAEANPITPSAMGEYPAPTATATAVIDDPDCWRRRRHAHRQHSK